jgi:hypothetical protein
VPLGGERAESIRAPEWRRIAGVGGVTEGVLAAGTSMAVEGLVSKKQKNHLRLGQSVFGFLLSPLRVITHPVPPNPPTTNHVEQYLSPLPGHVSPECHHRRAFGW